MSKKLEELITNAIAEGFVEGVKMFEESVTQTLKVHQVLSEYGVQVKDLVIDTIEKNQVINENESSSETKDNIEEKLNEFLNLLKEYE